MPKLRISWNRIIKQSKIIIKIFKGKTKRTYIRIQMKSFKKIKIWKKEQMLRKILSIKT